VSVQIRRVRYYTANVADRPGSAYEVLHELAQTETNLLAFSCVPVGPSSVQVTLFPDDPERLERTSGSMGLALMPPQQAFLVQGDDQIGVLADVHRRLYDAKISVYASSGVTDASGSFGYLIYVRPDDYDRAADIIGC
jgi:predicted amino acid-binding ACT domain protein